MKEVANSDDQEPEGDLKRTVVKIEAVEDDADLCKIPEYEKLLANGWILIAVAPQDQKAAVISRCEEEGFNVHYTRAYSVEDLRKQKIIALLGPVAIFVRPGWATHKPEKSNALDVYMKEAEAQEALPQREIVFDRRVLSVTSENLNVDGTYAGHLEVGAAFLGNIRRINIPDDERIAGLRRCGFTVGFAPAYDNYNPTGKLHEGFVAVFAGPWPRGVEKSNPFVSAYDELISRQGGKSRLPERFIVRTQELS